VEVGGLDADDVVEKVVDVRQAVSGPSRLRARVIGGVADLAASLPRESGSRLPGGSRFVTVRARRSQD
jgi:hypothetical protein